MTKPLSEQVAELEAERDRLKADAISDLITRQWLEVQVLNRERERDDLQRQVQEARDEVDELTRENTLASWKIENLKFEHDKVAGERNDLRAENDALRAGQGRWPGETIASEDVPFKGMSDLRYKDPDDDFPCCNSQPTGYADDDHQDAELTQWHQPSPRLTVRDLEAAPAGSVLSFGHLERTKGPYGLWIADTGATFSNKGMIERGFEDATLTTPEAQ